jgi:membrane-associated phospholipid phosphatase
MGRINALIAAISLLLGVSSGAAVPAIHLAEAHVGLAPGIRAHFVGAAQVSAQTSPSPQFVWNWARFSPWEYAITGTAAAGFITLGLTAATPSKPNWRGPVLFDDPVQDLLAAHSHAGKVTAVTISDVLLGILIAYTVFDAGAVVWAIDGNFDAASQLILLDLQSFAVSGLLDEVVKHTVARERSEDVGCTASNSSSCTSNTPHESFYSGHAAWGFTAAGLTCAEHRYIPLYGGGFPDGLACATSLTMATATGVLRVVADKHYISDVMVGAGLGFSSGYLLPALLHFDRPRKSDNGPTLGYMGFSWYAGGPVLTATGTL